MRRAAILIGVDKTGDLPKLKDAAHGALLMETWAHDQGMASVQSITDANEPVTVKRIKDAIKSLVDAANVNQLLVYFAGHGVNLQRQEYWLLSDAPDDTQAAVNVYSSTTLAATCGIPHIILMSDACRTAPEGIRAQSTRGSEIFPNREADTSPVDQFYACQLGKPSHEVKDPTVTSAEFKALYTHELVPALSGRRPQIVEWQGSGNSRVGHIHLRPLRDFLSAAVASRLTDLRLQNKVIQVPVAQISSDPPAWISEIAPAAGIGGNVDSSPPSSPPDPIAPAATPESITSDLLRKAMPEGMSPPRRRVRGGLFDVPQAADLATVAETERLAQPFGPTHHETGCGFKLRGARAVEAVARAATTSFATGTMAHGYDVRVHISGPPGANVLLVLEEGSGVLLPALPEFLCALTFEEGELIDVAYEPSEFTWRWSDFQNRAREIRSLRAIASSATARGTFKLEGDDALAIARRMQLAKGVDPSLALYAAYAYHDLQRRDLVRQMADYMQGDLQAVLFDVALLARKLDRHILDESDAPRLLGALPLLAQGWALLRAFGIRLPAALAPLQDQRIESLWTMFNSKGVKHIREAFAVGGLR